MDKNQLSELIYQALETEVGGVEIYAAALKCVRNKDLKEEWQKYHDETKRHVEVLARVCQELSLDVSRDTPGRRVLRHKTQALLQAMELAREAGDADAAELVAAECVIDAETKDHMNWDLIGVVAKQAGGEVAGVLGRAYAEVEDEEDEHLYHTLGFARELWIRSLGLPAALPPPEERRDVKSAAGAARAKQARGQMLSDGGAE